MTAAGYSGTPLATKLGIKAGTRTLLVKAPALPALEVPGGAIVHTRRRRGDYDVVVMFAADLASLRARFVPLIASVVTAGALWACWPKRASGIPTDLDENAVREHGLASGLVDVKVAAIDVTWSGLKFVRRLADR